MEHLNQIEEIFRPEKKIPEWMRRGTVSEQIRIVRETLGMTQAQLAERAGMTQSAVAQIENSSDSDIQLSTLERLARGLNGELLISFIPRQKISKAIEAQKEKVARRLLQISSGNAALELQLPDRTHVNASLKILKADLLRNYRHSLWSQ
jgi:predicted DNA-binding mobile mystery protein A